MAQLSGRRIVEMVKEDLSFQKFLQEKHLKMLLW